MALGFSSYARVERMLLRTRHILGEGTDPIFKEDNKVQALQYSASYYKLYGGNGSEVTYTDIADLTILQSEMIATRAALELNKSAISYYKDDVVTATGGPASASFRNNKLDWLKEFVKELEDKLDELEDAEGYGDGEGAIDISSMGLLLKKVMACADPIEDTCVDEPQGNWEKTAGGCGC